VVYREVQAIAWCLLAFTSLLTYCKPAHYSRYSFSY